MTLHGGGEFRIKSTLTHNEYRDFSMLASDARSRSPLGRWGAAYVIHGWWFAPIAFLLAAGLVARINGDSPMSFGLVGAAVGLWVLASLAADTSWRRAYRDVEGEEIELVIDARGLSETWRGVSWSAPWTGVETIESTPTAFIARTFSGVLFYAPLRAFASAEAAACVAFSRENANVARSP